MAQTQTDQTTQKQQTVEEPPMRQTAQQPARSSQAPQPAYDRSPLTSSLVEVIDRVLDKGVVIDAWVRISLIGIELLTIEARVVVASVETYLRYADALGKTKRIAGG